MADIAESHEFTYKLETFEGPLDLLLHLIEKNKINIYDIPIVEITDQYIGYVSAMPDTSLDILSEFLVMASTLLDIKARMLLPREVNEDGEEEDPRTELVERLLEYRTFRYISGEMRDMETDAEKVFYKEPTIPEEVDRYEQPVDLDGLLGGLTLTKLRSIYDILMKKKEAAQDTLHGSFGKIKRDRISIEQRISSFMAYARKHRKFTFRNMIGESADRSEVVVSFLACLELMRIGRIHLTQKEPFGDMDIVLLENEGGEDTDEIVLEEDYL